MPIRNGCCIRRSDTLKGAGRLPRPLAGAKFPLPGQPVAHLVLQETATVLAALHRLRPRRALPWPLPFSSCQEGCAPAARSFGGWIDRRIARPDRQHASGWNGTRKGDPLQSWLFPAIPALPIVADGSSARRVRRAGWQAHRPGFDRRSGRQCADPQGDRPSPQSNALKITPERASAMQMWRKMPPPVWADPWCGCIGRPGSRRRDWPRPS